MKFNLPKQVEYCISTLENNGFEAFCVGGAVRDHIMQRVPGDYDVTTNATPEEIIATFEKTVPTGIKHGTITVIIDNMSIEVTTYRTEGDYLDHRSPESVSFVNNVEGDLLRRDFTVNAICYHPQKGIYDPLGGVSDIKDKVIKAVGNAEERFQEDALRIMRAFRFSAQLGFNIQEATLTAALNKATTLSLISSERIATELIKAFVSNNPQKINPLLASGGLNHLGITSNSVIPNFIEGTPCDFSLRFALFCIENELEALDILTNLKLDNNTKSMVQTYIKMSSLNVSNDADIRRLLNLGDLRLTKTYLTYKSPEMLTKLEEIITRKDAYKISMLKVSGNDLLEKGFLGKDVGEILNKLLLDVIENPNLNTYENLINSKHLSR